VTYRFERIRVLTGYDVNQPEHRFTLQTAVLGAQLTGWPQP
jgi:DNA-binding PucR family transcriptional regulator